MKSSKYLSKQYLHMQRIQSYVELYKYVEDDDVIIEVGNGGGVFGDIANKIASYWSLDVDSQNNPDYNLDISDKDIVKKVFCCQVLEHIPFDKVHIALNNLFSLSNNMVVISIPDNRKKVRLEIHFMGIWIKRVITIPRTGKEITIENHGEHFFEISSDNYIKIRRLLMDTAVQNDFKLIKEYRLFERPYQHFFIFKQNEAKI